MFRIETAELIMSRNDPTGLLRQGTSKRGYFLSQWILTSDSTDSHSCPQQARQYNQIKLLKIASPDLSLPVDRQSSLFGAI
jgi:hypothetical protein